MFFSSQRHIKNEQKTIDGVEKHLVKKKVSHL